MHFKKYIKMLKNILIQEFIKYENMEYNDN